MQNLTFLDQGAGTCSNSVKDAVQYIHITHRICTLRSELGMGQSRVRCVIASALALFNKKRDYDKEYFSEDLVP